MGYLLFTFASAFKALMLVLAQIDKYDTCQVNLKHLQYVKVGPLYLCFQGLLSSCNIQVRSFSYDDYGHKLGSVCYA